MQHQSKPFTVVSYNVLSPQLANPQFYPKCTPRALDATNRLALVEGQLRDWMERGHIICLQEVTRAWADRFTVVAEELGYACVHAEYGTPRNGYMGVFTAWARDQFELVNCNTDRLADSLQLCPLAPPQPSAWRRFMDWLWATPPPTKDAATLTCQRYNRALTTRFKIRACQCQFGVVNYHMPCQFDDQEFMAAHVGMLLRASRAHFLDCRYVVAGDFNIRPGTLAYEALQAAVPEDSLSGPPWTCWTDSPRNGPFQDRLDYIIPFGFRQERVVETELPSAGPLPTENWPSDHVPVIKELVQ